ncbi:hypothetical protein PQ478_20935 [Alkalihalophilus pseudofirmus]|uniref:hypothetical protein n=1 Tax=Alkalihalophilus pseudofirmus TaxID=79885 RepID=UPI00259B7492|nr:hypothetical protein [Alkalihalophilus pseudofirmus]WEG16939.1 hypothetical protein PQ478_20935 [Alkalihalophilus pseudofirmus]
MKKAQKLSVAVLTLILSVSFTTGAMANNGNGNGKGLETAPGQSENFSKGVTTEVIVTTNETKGVEVNSIESAVTETKTDTDITEERVVIKSNTEKHPTKNEYRDVTVTATVRTVTTSTWDETTTTTTTTETPVTVIETIETTITHQGAPGSNGKVLSESSKSSEKRVEGEPIVTVATTTTKGELETSTVTEQIDEKEDKSGWKIGHNN